jgi:hypothetical protein
MSGDTLASATVFGGVFVVKAFAIGALAVDFFAFIVAPLLGMEVQGIEIGPNSPQLPKPGPTPKHPYGKAASNNYAYDALQKMLLV